MEKLEHESLEHAVKEFIVSTLGLEGVTAAEIDSQQPLFGEGLGLDSIDALEIGIGLQRTFGIVIDMNSEGLREQFASVSSLARLIESHRQATAA